MFWGAAAKDFSLQALLLGVRYPLSADLPLSQAGNFGLHVDAFAVGYADIEFGGGANNSLWRSSRAYGDIQRCQCGQSQNRI